MPVQVACYKCHTVSSSPGSQVGLREECSCGADLHICLNCTHYDSTSYNECKEPVAERVRDKDRSNFCDHFSALSTVRGKAATSVDHLRAAAEALFKKK